VIDSRRTASTDRERRLRARIDELTDERDRAQAQLAECRQARRRLTRRNWELVQSNENWRIRWAHRTRPLGETRK
jgi:FtsZ-binding cell division protein ZapB